MYSNRVLGRSFTSRTLQSRQNPVTTTLPPVVPGSEGRIPAAQGEICWIAALIEARHDYKLDYVCAGAIINSTHIVTAAHCVDAYRPADGLYAHRGTKSLNFLYVRAGDRDVSANSLDVDEPCTQTLRVLSITVDPRYDPLRLVNDLAYVQLDGKLYANNCTCRACYQVPGVTLASLRALQTAGDLSCLFAAYGQGSEIANTATMLSNVNAGTAKHKLTITNVNLLNNQLCQSDLNVFNVLPPGFTLNPMQFCTDNDDGLHGLCHGDGGAPLTCVRNSDGANILVGIGSWSLGCAISEAEDRSSPAIWQATVPLS